jgi:hypothetical protein
MLAEPVKIDHFKIDHNDGRTNASAATHSFPASRLLGFLKLDLYVFVLTFRKRDGLRF